jgi:hypothetical protein
MENNVTSRSKLDHLYNVRNSEATIQRG